MKSWNYQVAGTFDVSTTGNIDDLDFQKCSVIRMTNATLATIRGLKAGFPGQEVTIISTGAGQVNFSHQNAGSVAANRLINVVTSGITPLAAGKGRSTYKYDDTTARWRLINHNQGAWIDIPFSAGDFTASAAMTWTVASGDQITAAYWIQDSTLFLVGYWDTTTVGGVVSGVLQYAIPNGYTATKTMQGLALGFDNGVSTPTYNRVLIGGVIVQIGRSDAGFWSLSTDNTYVRVKMEFMID